MTAYNPVLCRRHLMAFYMRWFNHEPPNELWRCVLCGYSEKR